MARELVGSLQEISAAKLSGEASGSTGFAHLRKLDGRSVPSQAEYRGTKTDGLMNTTCWCSAGGISVRTLNVVTQF